MPVTSAAERLLLLALWLRAGGGQAHPRMRAHAPYS